MKFKIDVLSFKKAKNLNILTKSFELHYFHKCCFEMIFNYLKKVRYLLVFVIISLFDKIR